MLHEGGLLNTCLYLSVASQPFFSGNTCLTEDARKEVSAESACDGKQDRAWSCSEECIEIVLPDSRDEPPLANLQEQPLLEDFL